MAAAMTAGGLERVIREQLAVRDRARRARLFDQAAWDAADASAVAAIMTAAGFGAPEAAEKTIKRGRRAAAANQAAAFGDVA